MQKIYTYLDNAESAYLLKSGAVYFEIKSGEIHKIEGQNLIVGSLEVIRQYSSPTPVFRICTMHKDDQAQIEPINPVTLKKLLSGYNIGFNTCIFLAKLQIETNSILKERQAKKSENEKKYEENARKYYEAAKEIIATGEKFRFPDIIKLAETVKNEIIFETGQILCRPKASVQLDLAGKNLDSFNKSFPPGSVICQEGNDGTEMFIVNSGRIAVFIGQNQVAEIFNAGAVIGEIALILGEKRSATLKAVSGCVLSVIEKNNLHDFHSQNSDIFTKISSALAERVYHNFQMIYSIDKQLEKQTDPTIPDFLKKEPGQEELNQLFIKIAALQKVKKFEQLKPFMEKYKAEFEAVKNNKTP